MVVPGKAGPTRRPRARPILDRAFEPCYGKGFSVIPLVFSCEETEMHYRQHLPKQDKFAACAEWFNRAERSINAWNRAMNEEYVPRVTACTAKIPLPQEAQNEEYAVAA